MATETSGLPELMEGITEGGASSKTKGMLQGAKEALFGDEEEDEEEKEPSRKRSSTTTTRRRSRSGSKSSKKRSKSQS
jgi:hypothetical protein